MRRPTTAPGVAVLLAALLASPAVAQGDAPAVAPAACAQTNLASDWWETREGRIRDLEPTLPELRQFWAYVFTTLQTSTDRSAGHHPTCEVLERLLRAAEAYSEPGTRAADEFEAALAQESRLGETVRAPARPVIIAVGQAVGQGLESLARATPTTSERIPILDRAEALYTHAGLAGAAARVGLWVDAERTAWTEDRARVELDLQRAAEGGTSGPLALAGFLGGFEGLRRDLATDVATMRAHGASLEVQRVERAMAALEVRHAAALPEALGATVAFFLVAAVAVAVLRAPLRSLESDLLDAETATLGVPP
jgi:hypothetical protein